MSLRWVALLLFFGLTAHAADPKRFETHWNDRRAELSAYALTQPRYGAPRTGEAVMVWVLEPFSRSKAVKLDHPKATPDDVVRVMKLNQLREFQAGIYPYRLMTTVHVPVRFDVKSPVELAPQKVTFTSQEWCGTVHHQLVRKDAGWHSEWHSYFESEGDGEAMIPSDPKLVFEDETWFRVRELTSPFAPGTYAFVPSLAAVRLSHVPLERGTIAVKRAEKPESIKVPAGKFEVTKWQLDMTWGPGGAQKQSRTIWVESAWPHRIIAWEGEVASFKGNEPQKERAELTGSMRDTYWEHNRAGDEKLLKQLGLRQ